MPRKALLSSQGISTLFLSAFAIYGLVVLTIPAQVAPELHVLEMITSFLPHILVLGAVATIALGFHDRRIAAIGAALTLIAAAPFLTFSKYETPTGEPCPPNLCLTVITANIYSVPKAMSELSAAASREGADIVAINEAVKFMTGSDYMQAFPSNNYVVNAAWESMPKWMGNPIALLSRLRIADQQRVLRRDTGRRAYIVADLDDNWEGTRIVVAHAMTPVSPFGLQTRNTLLREAGKAAAQSDTFVMMGDFNLAPWTPTFRNLPGKRAGDPRISRTWPTAFGLFGIPIDHIMFSDDLELVEARVLGPIGSDHHPIMAKFKRKDR